MRFRPCIDIHNGKVKQIVGGSLQDLGDQARENFVSSQDSTFFAKLYQKENLEGGHIILLNPVTSPYYEATRNQAVKALEAYPKGLQIGGGITAENAAYFLEQGAGKVIVTSYVFQGGEIHYKNLELLVKEIGKENLVLDLSCRKRDGKYYIVTDRWQKYTNVILEEKSLDYFSGFCEEFLIHAVDVEGKAKGIEQEVAALLGSWGKLPMTYAGGIHSYEDLEELKALGKNKVDFTVGSALDLFGGNLEFEKICQWK
ncbi:MAG: phosphoribosylformimino-5-aminoimidazole carboxamide ribotide isomerase [Lachnospiraceae bacterium]|nr:phosphoribosylformimino-5-aminoimidazole carboxamide ribotide isomerase [Lachnospiraceae bacterium]